MSNASAWSPRPSKAPGVVFFNDVVGWGGTERYLHMLAGGLVRRGVSVLVVVPTPRPGQGDLEGFLRRFREVGIPVEVVRRPRTNAGRVPWSYRLFRRLARRLKTTTVVHFNQAVPGAHLLEVVGARLSRVGPVVCTNHLPVLGGSIRRLRRLALGLAKSCIDVTIVESERNKAIALAHRLCAEDRTIVVVHGIGLESITHAAVDAPSKAMLNLADSTFLIGSVGRLTRQKAYPRLLEAVRVMLTQHDTDAHVVIVGSGPERPELERMIDRLGLGDRVQLLGHRDDVGRLLYTFDVFALTSDFEGLPLAILESMAAGRPIVATDVGGVRDAVSHGETGLLVPPGDVGALAEALLTLARDRDLREQMGARAASLAQARFSSDRMVAETWEAYSVAASRR